MNIWQQAHKSDEANERKIWTVNYSYSRNETRLRIYIDCNVRDQATDTCLSSIDASLQSHAHYSKVFPTFASCP